MSFIIAMIDNKSKLYLAADTKIASKSGLFSHENKEKIVKISNSVAIAVAGQFDTASTIAKWVKDKYSPGMFI